MRRRDFLKVATAAAVVGGLAPRALADAIRRLPATGDPQSDASIRAYLERMRKFYAPHPGDTFISPDQFPMLEAVVRRLNRLQSMAGHGRFQLLSFDEGMEIGRQYPLVGAFTQPDLDFLEMIFFTDAAQYGFLGEKSITRLTDRIPVREVVKVPGSGNYVYRGRPLETYERVRNEIGELAILTSGVRGVMKQFLLFLRRTYENKGNFSLASRSLAPPGYSFHGISDFDLGQVGFGSGNFTEDFVTTEVFRKLVARDYFQLRYPQDNLVGVRFEPWHIKVDWKA